MGAVDTQDRLKEFMEEYDSKTGAEFLEEAEMMRALADVSMKEDGDCPVCLDNIAFDTQNAIMGCRHVFCLACIKDWISKRNDAEYVTCPVCRFKTSVVRETKVGEAVGARLVPVEFPPVQPDRDEPDMPESEDPALDLLSFLEHLVGPLMVRSSGPRRVMFTSSPMQHLFAQQRRQGRNWTQFTRARVDRQPVPEDITDDEGEDEHSEDESSADDPDHHVRDAEGYYTFTDAPSIEALRERTTQRMVAASGRLYEVWSSAMGSSQQPSRSQRQSQSQSRSQSRRTQPEQVGATRELPDWARRPALSVTRTYPRPTRGRAGRANTRQAGALPALRFSSLVMPEPELVAHSRRETAEAFGRDIERTMNAPRTRSHAANRAPSSN